MTVQNQSDSLASIYIEGKYKECLAQVEELRKKDLPADERIAVLMRGAQIKRELTDLGIAADMLEHAKEASPKAKDPVFEPAVELALNAVHSTLMKNKEATIHLVRLSESALARLKAIPGGARHDRLYVNGLCDLGITKLNAGEVALAGQNLRVAYGLAEERFGDDSPEMLYPAIALAVLHAVEGKHSLSLAVARNASQIARANFGNKHPLLIHPLYLMAQAAMRLGLVDISLDSCRKVEGLIIDNIGRESDIYVDVLGMKTAAFLHMVELEAAEKMATDRLKLMEKMRGKNNPKLIDPLCDLAQAQVRLGQREKAEKNFDRALKLVSEFARDRGFPDAPTDGTPEPVPTMGSRVGDASPCHLENELITSLQDCYLWQGKLADVAKLMPASMRAHHTSRVDFIVNVIEGINNYIDETAKQFMEDRKNKSAGM